MGTSWEVTIWDELSVDIAKQIQARIISETQSFDRTYSRFISSSFVMGLSDKTGIVRVPPDFVPMLRLYFSLFHVSGKKFTPLVGTTLSDMGYDETYSFREKEQIHPVPDLDRVVKIVDDCHIKLSAPTLFDFGALGKGYFVQKIAQLLSKENIQRFLVNGSGDISYEGNEIPIQAGLEHPHDPKKVIGSIELKSGSLCSSSNNRRSWGNHRHIIDPQSLSSETDIIATWVFANSAPVSDALATALFLSPPESFENHFDFEYLVLNKDMRVKRSKGFHARLY